MERTTLQAHGPVGFAGAFVRQFRLLWTSRRPLLLLVALLGGLLLSGEPWVDDPKARLLTLWPIWLTLIGPFWAFAVFHNEGPGNRFYHWSQPVSRPLHSGARLVAGLAWLWLIFALFLLTGWGVAVADGEAWQLAEIGVGGWLNFFTGPLIGYLAVSILTVPSDYPIRWFFGILFLFPLALKIVGDWLGLESLAATIVEPLNNQDWGLGITLVGGLNEDINRLERTLRTMANPEFRARSVELAADWWVATPAWILLLAAVVAFMATLHPDVMPRLRRR